jgi:hypothetical protein
MFTIGSVMTYSQDYNIKERKQQSYFIIKNFIYFKLNSKKYSKKKKMKSADV